MATNKAEFLAHHCRRRIRPRSHHSMGWLPAAARLTARALRIVNTLVRTPGVRAVALMVGGVDSRRELPLFADQTFQRWYANRRPRANAERGEVIVWPDTFTNHFTPAIGRAAVDVLEDAGYRGIVPTEPLCCGLTWISTGQLATAKRVLRRTVSILSPWLREGVRVVGLEPSCTAVLRSDAAELFPVTGTSSGSPIRPSPWPSCYTTLTAGGRQASMPRPSRRHIVTSTPSSDTTITESYSLTPESSWTSPTRDAAAWPETSASRRATTKSRWPAPNGYCSRRSGTRRPTPSSLPTASAAARRSSTAPTVDPSTSPNCWPPAYTTSRYDQFGLNHQPLFDEPGTGDRMRYEHVDHSPTGQRTYVLVLDAGEEVMGAMHRFADDEWLDGASFTSIGALERATLAWFDLEAKEYRDIAINEQVEVLACTGDIAIGPNGDRQVHAHAVVSGRDGAAKGGHLRQALVRPTLEVVLTEPLRQLRRTFRPEFGIALIDLKANVS